jgi:hypothetical protein
MTGDDIRSHQRRNASAMLVLGFVNPTIATRRLLENAIRSDWRYRGDRIGVHRRKFRKSSEPLQYIGAMDGGEGGIRTHGTLARTTVFETAPFGHSGTSPQARPFHKYTNSQDTGMHPGRSTPQKKHTHRALLYWSCAVYQYLAGNGIPFRCGENLSTPSPGRDSGKSQRRSASHCAASGAYSSPREPYPKLTQMRGVSAGVG